MNTSRSPFVEGWRHRRIRRQNRAKILPARSCLHAGVRWPVRASGQCRRDNRCFVKSFRNLVLASPRHSRTRRGFSPFSSFASSAVLPDCNADNNDLQRRCLSEIQIPFRQIRRSSDRQPRGLFSSSCSTGGRTAARIVLVCAKHVLAPRTPDGEIPASVSSIRPAAEKQSSYRSVLS